NPASRPSDKQHRHLDTTPWGTCQARGVTRVTHACWLSATGCKVYATGHIPITGQLVRDRYRWNRRGVAPRSACRRIRGPYFAVGGGPFPRCAAFRLNDFQERGPDPWLAIFFLPAIRVASWYSLRLSPRLLPPITT